MTRPATGSERELLSPSRLLDGLGLLLLALLVAAYFWFIQNYGVNTLSEDQWFDVRLLNHQYTGTLTLPLLWAQHGENRIFVQNLLMLALAHTTNYNVVLEEFLSGLMLVTSCLLVILAHRRRAPRTPFLYYVPVAVLMLSFVQSENTLYGFQVGWYVIVLALATVIFLFDAPRLGVLVFALAVAMAVAGSFSSIQGLLIWPTGLYLLFRRERSAEVTIAWVVAAVATGVLYFDNYSFSSTGGSFSYVLTHPGTAARFFLVAVGDIIGFHVSDTPGAGAYVAIVIGIVVLITACWILVAYGPRRAGPGDTAAGVSLVVFGILYAGMFTVGRIGFGLTQASLSAYTTYTLLIPVGCYLALLGQRAALRRRLDDLLAGFRQRTRLQPPELRRSWRGAASVTLCGALGAVVCFQMVTGTANGIANAREGHAFQLAGLRVTANIKRAPDPLVRSFLASGYETAPFIRHMAALAEIHHLSLFDTSLVTVARRSGLPVGHSVPVTALTRPTSGQRLAGNQLLGASASDIYGVIRVQIEVTGPSPTNSVTIEPAGKFNYGWISAWNTRSVPDGTYRLRSVAYNSAGDRGFSAPVTVEVRN